jgi:hypothetical protein
MATETVTYYALRESDEPEVTGLFRKRLTPRAMDLERLDRNGVFVRDNALIYYLAGYDNGYELVSEREARRIARRLGGDLDRD